MKLLLEYNEAQQCFHYNAFEETTLQFEKPLFTFGWKPICFISEHLAVDKKDKGFGKLLNKLADGKHSYQQIFEEVIKFIVVNDEPDEAK